MTDQEMQATEEEVELVEEPSESLAEETAEQPEQPKEAEAQPEQGQDETPEWFQKAIDRQTWKYREEQRRADAYRKEVEELRAKVQPQADPEIPDLPDPFAVSEEEYRQAQRARDEAIMRKAANDAQRSLAEQQARAQAQAQQRQQQEQMMKSVQTYSERAEKLGVSAQDLQVAGNAVAAYGVPNELTQYILQDEQGPLITTYLARNPQEIMQLNSMHPTQAAVHIATQIAPKVQPKPTKTQAPQPPETLGGGGAPPADDGPPGATYE